MQIFQKGCLIPCDSLYNEELLKIQQLSNLFITTTAHKEKLSQPPRWNNDEIQEVTV
jgi:hypothetical protein